MGAATPLTSTLVSATWVASGGAGPEVNPLNESSSPFTTATSPGVNGSPGLKVALSCTPWKSIFGGPFGTTIRFTGTVIVPFTAFEGIVTVAEYDPGCRLAPVAST